MTTSDLVHIVDDDDGMRHSLEFLLAASALNVRGYATGDEFLAALPAGVGGCIVTDVRMPGMSGLDLLRHVRRSAPDLPVIVMTGHGDVRMAVEAMKAGAFDFVEKPFDDAEFLRVVRAALSRAGNAAATASRRADIALRMASLTEREREVFRGLVAGQANKEIARELGISHRTVEIYRANVMTKLQAGSLSDVVRMAFQSDGSGKTYDSANT